MNTTLHEVAPPVPSPSCDWQPFTDRLAAALATLDEDQNLILEVEHRQRFVQFSGSGASGLRAETVSNAYLAENDQHTPDQVAALTAAGWRSPTHAPDASPAEQDRAGSPNYFADFAVPVPFGEVADLAVRTLAEVFAVADPGLLEYGAFTTQGHPLLFPGLCLRRAERSGSTSESQPSIEQELLAAISAITGLNDLEFDSDGDICLSRGSQVLFVRRLGETPFARIWSPLLRGVDETPELLAHVNSLNGTATLVRFHVRDGVVLAEADWAAEPFVAMLVDQSLRQFCVETDGVDVLLQREFGGDTVVVGTPPGASLH
jgi:hypothetical protein